MCCVHQLPSGLSRRAGRSRGRSRSDRPVARQPTSLNQEQSESALPCHPVILVACIAVAPTPGGKSACANFFRETEHVNRTASEWRHRLHGDNIVDHVVCLKAEFLWHTVLSNENGEFYTYDIYPYLMKVFLLFKREFPRVLMTWRTAHANFKYEVTDVNNGIPIDFRAIKCVSVESGQPCRDNISWYI